jgi:hypothetical protein
MLSNEITITNLQSDEKLDFLRTLGFLPTMMNGVKEKRFERYM